jgi:hypothetical protein
MLIGCLTHAYLSSNITSVAEHFINTVSRIKQVSGKSLYVSACASTYFINKAR